MLIFNVSTRPSAIFYNDTRLAESDGALYYLVTLDDHIVVISLLIVITVQSKLLLSCEE